MRVHLKKSLTVLSIGVTCILLTGCVDIKGKTPIFQKETSDKTKLVDERAEVKKNDEEENFLTTRIVFVNFTENDICSLYASMPDSNDWGENLLDEGSVESSIESSIESGYYTPVKFKHPKDKHVWSFAIEDTDGNRTEYSDLDLTNYESKGLTVYLSEDGSYDIYDGTDDYETKLQEWIYANPPEQFAYDNEDLFKIYQLILADYWSGDVLGDYSNVCSSDLLEDYVNYGKEIGYAYIDINYDDVPEIIFGAAGESNMGEFVAVYTIDEVGNIIEVDTGSSKIEKHLCYDGSIAAITKDDGEGMKYEFYSLVTEEAQVSLSVDYQLYYTGGNNDGGMWLDGGDMSSDIMSSQKARDICNMHPYMPIEYTALIDLPYAVYH